MAAGLMKRYREAGEAAPKVMYVDRDCCSQHGQSRVKIMFSEWDELEVRLDIWHFMRRFAAGVTTEAHPLYGIFMARLSACIFQWDPEDVAALRHAKEGELVAKKTGHISERAVSARITRRELALHCRRRTRGLDETTRSIGSLINLFDSTDGKDTLGVPLLDHERIQQIWKEQRKHVQCIQDPENFPLYMKTGDTEERWCGAVLLQVCPWLYLLGVIPPPPEPFYSRYYIYIYAFCRRFYPKRLTLHSIYSFIFISSCFPWESKPMILALLARCSTIELQEGMSMSYILIFL